MEPVKSGQCDECVVAGGRYYVDAWSIIDGRRCIGPNGGRPTCPLNDRSRDQWRWVCESSALHLVIHMVTGTPAGDHLIPQPLADLIFTNLVRGRIQERIRRGGSRGWLEWPVTPCLERRHFKMYKWMQGKARRVLQVRKNVLVFGGAKRLNVNGSLPKCDLSNFNGDRLYD